MNNDKLKLYVASAVLYMAAVFLLAFLLEEHPFIVSGIFIFLGLGGAAYFGQKIGNILAEREIEKINKEKEAKRAAEAEASSEVLKLTLYSVLCVLSIVGGVSGIVYIDNLSNLAGGLFFLMTIVVPAFILEEKVMPILTKRDIEKIKKEKEAKKAREAEASSEVPEITLRDLDRIVKRAKELNNPPEAHIQFKGKYVAIRSPGIVYVMPIKKGVEDPDK